MPLGDVLYESTSQLQYAYFPTSAIVSLHYVTESGASSEIAAMGNEGVVGVSLFMGGTTPPSRAIVYTGGFSYRLKARVLIVTRSRLILDFTSLHFCSEIAPLFLSQK